MGGAARRKRVVKAAAAVDDSFDVLWDTYNPLLDDDQFFGKLESGNKNLQGIRKRGVPRQKLSSILLFAVISFVFMTVSYAYHYTSLLPNLHFSVNRSHQYLSYQNEINFGVRSVVIAWATGWFLVLPLSFALTRRVLKIRTLLIGDPIIDWISWIGQSHNKIRDTILLLPVLLLENSVINTFVGLDPSLRSIAKTYSTTAVAKEFCLLCKSPKALRAYMSLNQTRTLWYQIGCFIALILFASSVGLSTCRKSIFYELAAITGIRLAVYYCTSLAI